MSYLIENSRFLLQDSLQKAIELYQKNVVPRLTKQNKTIAISTAVALSLIYMVGDRYLRPPRNIRHLPYQSYYDFLKSILTKESYCDRANRVLLPTIDSESNTGFYVRPGRLGWEIHVANPEAAKKIFLKHELFPKADTFQGKEKTLNSRFTNGPNLVFLNGSHWKNQRMISNPAFHRAQPIQLFGKLTQELFEQMELWDSTVDVSNMMERWTLEAIGKAGFGFDFNAIKDDKSPWVHTYNTIMNGLQHPLHFFFPSLDQSFIWLFPSRQRIHKELTRFLDMLSEVIKKKRKDIANNVHNDSLPENEKDVLTLLIEAEQRGEGGLTDEELRSNLNILFLAGHDTTSNTLSFALYYLAKYPEIQQRAREEVLSIFGDEPKDVIPVADQLSGLDYINQIIKETLRINGPVVQSTIRVSKEDTVVSGLIIPKDTYVSVDIYNIQHSKKIWKNPNEFRPERFARNGESSQLASEGITWVPFGYGARQCIGMNFSLNEQRVFLSMMLRKFTWKLPENTIHKDELITEGIAIVGPSDLKIQFTKRY